MTEHTSAPWTLTHKAGTSFAVQRFEIRGSLGETENIYPIFQKDILAIDGTTVCCSPQNALLITAAPELLAAAEALEKAEFDRLLCDECDECEDSLDLAPETCAKCSTAFDDARIKRRNAIAKAHGKALTSTTPKTAERLPNNQGEIE